jgi:serine/threonine protein kinase
MANSLDDFWKLLVDSGLLAAAECEDLKSAFARAPGTDQGNTKSLCAWLIERGMLSRYQARLLLAGRSGPFFFGDYRVYDRVESGRLKGLFRAAHRENGEPVLLYFFAGAATQDLRKWLPVEARSQLAAAVKHPNVSRVDALIQADGYKFLVMEGLEGKSLDELAQGKPLPLGDVCRYLRKAATGLARLHNLNQIHADIRPDTLWLEHSGQLKLLYFPLSRDPFGPAAALDPSNADYLAPECVLPGGKSPDVLSDIYSLGCTAYHLLSGQVPYPGGDAADKARRHASAACVPLDQLAGLPSPVASLIARMMAKDPQERPATAVLVADEVSVVTPAAGHNEENIANGRSQPAKPNGQTPTARPREQAPAATGATAATGAPAATAAKPVKSTEQAAVSGPRPPQGSPANPQRAAGKPQEPTPRPPAAVAKPRGPEQARPTAPRPVPAANPGVAGSRPVAKPAAAASKPAAPPLAGRQPIPTAANVPPPPPPPGAPLGGWPAMQPADGQVAMSPPPVSQPAGIAPPPPPPPGFAPQHPAFVPQAMPVMGVPVASGPPMGQPAFGPVMGMPVFAPQGYAAPMPQTYGVPQEQAPLVGASRQPAAFDSGVMNVLADVAAGPVSGAAAKGAAAPARRTRKRQEGLSPQTIGLGIGALMIVLVGVGVLVMSRGNSQPVNDPPIAAAVEEGTGAPETESVSDKKPPADSPAADEETTDEAKEKEPSKRKPKKDPGPQMVEDDGKSLWVSPTSGPPIDVQYLPPGTQALLVLRPHDLLTSTAEGEKVLTALGPGGAWAKAQVESISGVPLAEMEQIIVAFSSLAKGPPQAALVVRLAEPRPADQLMAAWGNPSSAADGKAYFTGPNWAYFLPPDGQNKVLVICGAKEMGELVDMDGPPPMRKEMEKLLRQTDAMRHFTLLVAPNYLENDGKSLLDGELERLRGPLGAFFGEIVQAAALSLNFGQDFFAELRLYSTDIGPEDLARQTRERLTQIPDQVESYIANLSPHPYGKLVLLRFAPMLRVVDEYTRVGEEENQAILRCFLPLSAGHNLIMGTELALFERGAGAPAAGGAVAKKASGPVEALKQKITLSFTRDTLEKTMEMLGREIDTEIVILGSDLQLEGITKNQSFGLDEKNKPAGEILQTVMMKANPDGKLIYVFKPKNPGEKDIIFITTRASAEKRGDKVPPELVKAGTEPAKTKAKK